MLRKWIATGALAFAAIFAPVGLIAQDLRIATYNTQLTRKGPGLLLRDILGAKDPQVIAVLQVITTIKPDVLVLQDFDHDVKNHALIAFQNALADNGHAMPYAFANQPNSGLATGQDMDGNGKTGEARDAQGYGRFTGQGGMAVLSTYPLSDTHDFSDFLWRDLPGAIPPMVNGVPFPSPTAFAAQRLSSVAHWDVAVRLPNQPPLRLLTFHATTPVFDGEEDRNGRRNHDEITFWQKYLDGELPYPAPQGSIIVLGDANLDPNDGQGRREAIRRLLRNPRLQDSEPRRHGDAGTVMSYQSGDPALDTVDWPEPNPGNLRVSYILPDEGLNVIASGVFWPLPDDPMHKTVASASRHRLVWVDIRF